MPNRIGLRQPLQLHLSEISLIFLDPSRIKTFNFTEIGADWVDLYWEQGGGGSQEFEVSLL